MKRHIHTFTLHFTFCLLYMGTWSIGSFAHDAESDQFTKEERQNLQADAMRQQSLENARSQLGYDDALTFQYPRDRTIDFQALSNQIAHLGSLIQSAATLLGSVAGNPGFVPKVPSDLSAIGALPGKSPSGQIHTIYGPDGPNAKSVRFLLEYRLMVAGNPRLTIGNVTEDEEKVIAQIVTVDGSLVEKYSVDKSTGLWKPIR